MKETVIDSHIRVIVLIITYNHEMYIAQAIESVLMQETNFGYEIVIGDDCSTDRTREILIEYQKKYPDSIRLLLHKINLGANANYRKAYAECNSEYLAYLEGDDFWIDRKKLQKQFEFMENNKDFSMCFTGAKRIDENGSVIHANMVPERYRKNLTQREIIDGYIPPGLTAFARRYPLMLPDCSLRLINQDFFETVMITEYGDAGYLPEITSCSRMHSGGIWAMKDEEYYAVHGLELSEALLECFGYKYKDMLLSKVRWRYDFLIRLYLRRNQFVKLIFLYLRLSISMIRYELTDCISTGCKEIASFHK